MDNWGEQVKRTEVTIAEMTAIGLELPADALSMFVKNGNMYLSPPGTDLELTKPGDIIASFHKDFCLFTVHGRCRFSGLYAWLLTGERFPVKLPPKHLLIQGGTQL